MGLTIWEMLTSPKPVMFMQSFGKAYGNIVHHLIHTPLWKYATGVEYDSIDWDPEKYDMLPKEVLAFTSAFVPFIPDGLNKDDLGRSLLPSTSAFDVRPGRQYVLQRILDVVARMLFGMPQPAMFDSETEKYLNMCYKTSDKMIESPNTSGDPSTTYSFDQPLIITVHAPLRTDTGLQKDFLEFLLDGFVRLARLLYQQAKDLMVSVKPCFVPVKGSEQSFENFIPVVTTALDQQMDGDEAVGAVKRGLDIGKAASN
eukprot:5285241-Amphidinium_carterae.1